MVAPEVVDQKPETEEARAVILGLVMDQTRELLAVEKQTVTCPCGLLPLRRVVLPAVREPALRRARSVSTDDDRAGEYWQAPLQPEVHPDDSCGCLKPPGFYGRHGWHFNAAGEAVERCPTYMATVKRHGGWKRPRRKR